MNIIVTGSNGYIGSNFIDAFKDKHIFSKFSLQRNSLKHLHIDNIDTILHCAALVHQKNKVYDEQYYEINTKYPVELAKKAKECGVKQFVFISSIAVHSSTLEYVNESSECFPDTPYGKSKLDAERELEKLNDENFIVSIIRPPMVYGKDAPGNIRTLITLVKKVPVLPFARIDNNRSFIYIGNLTHFINKIIEKKIAGIFLVSDDKSISTTYLIELIAKELNRKIYLVKVPFFERLLKMLKPSLYKRLYESLEVNNSASKEALKYKNLYSTEDGIKYMIHGEII